MRSMEHAVSAVLACLDTHAGQSIVPSSQQTTYRHAVATSTNEHHTTPCHAMTMTVNHNYLSSILTSLHQTVARRCAAYQHIAWTCTVYTMAYHTSPRLRVSKHSSSVLQSTTSDSGSGVIMQTVVTSNN